MKTFFQQSSLKRSLTISGIQEVVLRILLQVFPLIPNLHSEAGFPATSESLDCYLLKSATSQQIIELLLQNKSCEESIQWFLPPNFSVSFFVHDRYSHAGTAMVSFRTTDTFSSFNAIRPSRCHLIPFGLFTTVF